MSGDETFVLMIAFCVAAATWGTWLWHVSAVRPHGANGVDRKVFVAVPFVCGAVLIGVLRAWASFDVQEDIGYTFLYVILGAAWVGAGTRFISYLGLSAREDVLERGNRAATPAIAGALLAVTLCFAGGNIGDGPGWWCVVFAALLSSTALALLWIAYDALTKAVDRITIDRDAGAGWRAGALVVAWGVILGRGVAGNWVSAWDTTVELFVGAWPVLALLALAVVVERALLSKRATGGGAIAAVVVTSAIHLATAGGWVASRGHW